MLIFFFFSRRFDATIVRADESRNEPSGSEREQTEKRCFVLPSFCTSCRCCIIFPSARRAPSGQNRSYVATRPCRKHCPAGGGRGLSTRLREFNQLHSWDSKTHPGIDDEVVLQGPVFIHTYNQLKVTTLPLLALLHLQQWQSGLSRSHIDINIGPISSS